MNNLASLIFNDFKNIFRDDILKILLFVPFIIMLLVYFGLPPLVKLVPDLAEYQFIIIVTSCLLIATMPAYIVSFIMLDEKDEGIFIVFKILPMSDMKFFAYRMGFILAFSFVFTLCMLFLLDLPGMALWQKLSASVQFSLLPPVLCLVTVTFARNKIEGMTLMKLLNFLVFIPVVGFFVDTQYKYLFAIIPVFWSYHIMEIFQNEKLFAFSLIIGVVSHLLALIILFRIFIKRV